MGSGNHMVDGADEQLSREARCISCGKDDWEEVSLCEYDETRDCEGKCVNHTDHCKPVDCLRCNECGEIRELK